MGLLKLMVLFALMTILKAQSINWEVNIAQETATMNTNQDLVPTMQEINQALIPMSNRLNKSESTQNSTATPVVPVASRFSLFSHKDKETAEGGIRLEYAFYRLQFLIQSLFKAIINAIVEMIRRGNNIKQLAFINFMVYFGLFLGFGPGVLVFFGVKFCQIVSRIIRSPLNFVARGIGFFIKIVRACIPSFILDFIRKIIIQACGRGLTFIVNNIKRSFDFVAQ